MQTPLLSGDFRGRNRWKDVMISACSCMYRSIMGTITALHHARSCTDKLQRPGSRCPCRYPALLRLLKPWSRRFNCPPFRGQFNEILYKFARPQNSLMWCFWAAITLIWPSKFIQVGKRQEMRSLFCFCLFFFLLFSARLFMTMYALAELLSFISFKSWCSIHNFTLHPIAELRRGPVGQILCLEKEVLVLEKNRLLLSPSSSCFFSWGSPDNSCAFGNYVTEKVCIRINDQVLYLLNWICKQDMYSL